MKSIVTLCTNIAATQLPGQRGKSLKPIKNSSTERAAWRPFSSLTYSWDNNIAAGNRVSNIRVGGVAIHLASTYRVTVNSFLADGGDGFTTLLAGVNRLGGAQDIDALIEYLAANRPYAPELIRTRHAKGLYAVHTALFTC
jgi:2',3'-cyclic-nucleotide 2'-phosphodiesterase (5'-nucleotidase family)